METPNKNNYTKSDIEKIFGKEATAPATEQEKEKAYYFLGIIATTFAEIEKHLQSFIGVLEGLNFTGYRLIDNNTLEKNLQLLEDINKFRKFKLLETKYFIKEIRKIKNDRNSLIHGVWEIFRDENLQPVVSVRTFKTKYSIVDGKDTWKMGDQTIYTFAQMNKLINTAKHLNEHLKDILAAYIAKDHPGSEGWIRNSLNKT